MSREWNGLRAFAAIAIGASLGSLPGCGVPDEIVAREGPPDAGAAPVATGQACATSDDCGDPDGGGAYYCSMTSCGATAGTCEKKPTTCSDFGPVCGCTTGLLYWSDCLRQQHGESATGMATDCKATCTSTDAGACPAGSYCALFNPGCEQPMDPRVPGVCLVLPAECSSDAVLLPGANSSLQALSCATHTCMDYCSAVKAGGPISLPCQ
jgi:hypothetical protein